VLHFLKSKMYTKFDSRVYPFVHLSVQMESDAYTYKVRTRANNEISFPAGLEHVTFTVCSAQLSNHPRSVGV